MADTSIVAPSLSAAAGAPRILVVDDEQIIRAVVERSLRAVCGVDLAASAEAACALFAAGADYAQILCDVTMPGGDGFHLLRVVRDRFPHYAHRFTFMTGGARTREDTERLEHCGVPILLKPFDRSTLISFVQRHLPATPIAEQVG